jgi:hypothetical protein
LWFELMRWPFRTMWCFVYPSNASDRWVLIACGAGLATSVETPEDSLHQECDQCKLQIWTWHTDIFVTNCGPSSASASSIRVTR